MEVEKPPPDATRSWTCIGFFGTPRHDMCKRERCDCPCHSAESETDAYHVESGATK